jgi:hypothetical protein
MTRIVQVVELKAQLSPIVEDEASSSASAASKR